MIKAIYKVRFLFTKGFQQAFDLSPLAPNITKELARKRVLAFETLLDFLKDFCSGISRT